MTNTCIQLPQIAVNLDAFLNSLFKGPRTFDGYLIKPSRRGEPLNLWTIRIVTTRIKSHCYLWEVITPDGSLVGAGYCSTKRDALSVAAIFARSNS